MSSIVALIVGILITAAVIMTVVRIFLGPSILDRVISTEVLMATLITGTGAIMVLSDRDDLLPVMIGVAMLGLIASISVARVVSTRPSQDSHEPTVATEEHGEEER